MIFPKPNILHLGKYHILCRDGTRLDNQQMALHARAESEFKAVVVMLPVIVRSVAATTGSAYKDGDLP